MLPARIRNLLIPLACSAALTAVVTWPLVVTTGQIADWCDTSFSTWVLAWETHALSTAPTSIANANIFWPARDALFYGPAALGALPWFAPVYLATGDPVRAINVTLLLCLTLTGASLHWLVWHWKRSHAAGFVAAATFLTTPWVAQVFVPLTPHIAALQLFPMVVYLASSNLARMRQVVALTIVVIVQCLTDLVYVAPAVLAPLGALAVIRLARGSSRRSGVRLAGVVVASSAVLAPLLYRYASVSASNPEIAQQTLWVNQTGLTSLPNDLVTPDRPASFRLTVVTLVLIGLALTLLRQRGLTRLFRSRAWRGALFWCVAGLVLSLGLRIDWGSIEVPGPQGLLAEWLPAINRVRVPSRLGIASLIGLSLLAGIAFATLAGHLRLAMRPSARARVWVAALALVVAERMRVDYGPLAIPPIVFAVARVDAGPPPASFLAALARVPGPLVELPSTSVPVQTKENRTTRTVQAMTFARQQVRAMFNSTFHWHPILNGYSSYFPAGFADRLRLVDLLPDADALAQLVPKTNLRFVWVHLDRLNPKRRKRWMDATASSDAPPRRPALRMVAQEENDLLFIVER